jgi:thymidine phosphorylase
VGLRVLARVGQKVAKGDLLFQVYAGDKASIVPDLYLSSLEWTSLSVAPTAWLLASIGC